LRRKAKDLKKQTKRTGKKQVVVESSSEEESGSSSEDEQVVVKRKVEKKARKQVDIEKAEMLRAHYNERMQKMRDEELRKLLFTPGY
jgi:hypothetical protein